MKSKVLQAVPTVFSLRPNSDYSRFVVHGGAQKMMGDTWAGVGRRMDGAIKKVARDVSKKQTTKV